MGYQELVGRILERFPLCRLCLARQLPEQWVLPPSLEGVELKGSRCYICGGLMDRLEEIAAKAMEAMRSYEFQSFVVGARLSSDLLEREDLLRSEMKLRGGEGMKGQLTRLVGSIIAAATGKKVSYSSPDLMVLLEPERDRVEITSKHLFIYGRYTKRIRGLPQKKRRCRRCRGRGCGKCDGKGFMHERSVEALIEEALCSAFGARKATFTWLGSEDRRSLVLGKGRPFYAELASPRVRSPRALRSVRRAGVSLRELKVISARPEVLPSFDVKVRIKVHIPDEAMPSMGRTVKGMAQKLLEEGVTIYRQDGRSSKKRIYKITYRRPSAGGRTWLFYLYCEGGINIRSFVTGERGMVKPSLSDLLGCEVKLDDEEPFDVLDVLVREERPP